MSNQKNIIKIARECEEEILTKGTNNKTLSEKFDISLEETLQLKNYVRAFKLEKQEENGIPHEWYETATNIGEISIRYIKNREWGAFERYHHHKFKFPIEDLKEWGNWLLAREEVGHLIDLTPLFNPLSEPSEEKPTEEKASKENNSLKKYVSDKRIWYDETRDTYTTYLPGVPHAIELPGEVHRDLIRAYSNFAGKPASVNELARTFQLPRNWIIKYLRIHEVTHDREPFTPEEIMERSEEELAQEALQIRRAALYTRLERDKWREIQKDAQRWREYEAYTLRRIEKIVERKIEEEIPQLEIPKLNREFAAVITPTDFHWGKYGDVHECGEKYDRPTAKEKLILATKRVLADIIKHGRPEKIIIGIGSDFFNADTYAGTTTQGTPQDNDGNIADILSTGCDLMTLYIDMLQQVAPVQMVLMAGNHDQLLSVSLHLYLDAWYRNCNAVTTVRCAKSRQYVIYKDNLLCFHHGDGVKKTSDLARLAAIEAPEEWGRCKHRMVFTGHLHYEKIEEDRGFTRYQLPSLSGEDKWHAKQGYIGNKKMIAAVLIDKKEGVFSSIYGSGN